MFDTLQDRLSATFRSLRGKGRLSESDVNEALREIRLALLEADVNLSVVKEFIAACREKLAGAEASQALNPTQQIVKVVNEELVAILGGQTREIRFAKNPPTVIMLAGLQGSGKTTLAGKLAKWLKEHKHQPLLVAADLQRPNAVNQLQVMGQRAAVAVFAPEPGNGVGDPVAVARASIEEARRKLYDVVIVDTAGRLGVDAELMQQAIDIRNAVNPDEILFVVDAMIGQDAVNTAQAFAQGVGFDGVVLSKLDGDARGGAALSIARVTGKPIMFASNGENLKDFDLFHPDRMASRILDMGDLLTLIEKAEKTFDAEQSQKAAEKLLAGKQFGLDDFLSQMQAVRKMGPMSKILGMMPGMGQYKEQIGNIDEREIDRIEAIIYSMTPAERANPDILNGSRRNRIARGSGTTVTEVNALVNRFAETRKMMQQLGNMGALGLPGARGKAKQQAARKKSTKGVSGNPLKRAQVAAAAQAAPAKAPEPQQAAFDEFGLPISSKAPATNPFGFGGGGASDEFQLPPELAKMFDQKK